MSELPSPICSTRVPASSINDHIDAGCPPSGSQPGASTSTSQTAIPSSPTVHAATHSSLKRKATGNPKTPLAPIFSLKRKKSTPGKQAVSEEVDVFDEPVDLMAESPPKRPKVLPTTKSVKDTLRDAAPLAERMRPEVLDDFVGQEHLVGKDGLLRSLLETGRSGSLILVRISYFPHLRG